MKTTVLNLGSNFFTSAANVQTKSLAPETFLSFPKGVTLFLESEESLMSERKLDKLEDGRVFDINAPWDGELKDDKFVKPDRPITGGMLWESIPLGENESEALMANL